MIIRRATGADVELLARLNQDIQLIHAEAYPDIFKRPDHLAAVAADFESRILGNVNGYVLIAEVEGEAVGYIYAQTVERPENPYTFAQRLMNVDQISVRPKFQNMGYGHMLIQAVVDLAKTHGIKRIVLDTYAFNRQAQSFYDVLGFKAAKYQMVLDFN